MGVADKAKSAVAEKHGGNGHGGNLPAKQTPKTMVGYKSGDVAGLLNAYKLQIAQALPKHVTAERIIQLATTIITRSPEIKSCTPESVIGAVMNASMLGLDITPQFGQAYFVPYNNSKTGHKEAQFMLGYKGWIQLFRRSGEVSTVYAEVVRDGDLFDVELGLENSLKHKPNFEKRGELIACYAVVKYKDGGYNFVVLTKQDVLNRRMRSRAASKGGPWETDPEAMWRKSAIRALIPYVPASVEMLKAAMTDGAVVTSEMFSNETKDLDLDKVQTAEEAESEDITGQEEQKQEETKEEVKAEAQPDPAKDLKVEYIQMATPLMSAIIKAKGSDYFARVLATCKVNNLEDVRPEQYNAVITALQYEADNLKN